MDLKDFIAIRGKGDLYRVMSKSTKGIIVETLNDKRTKFKVQPNLQVLILNDITIYAHEGDDIRLLDVLLRLFDKSGIDLKVDLKSDVTDIIELFREIAPGYDEEKVYLSDMKKTLRWYMTLCQFYPDLFTEIKKNMEEEKKDEEDKTEKAETVEVKEEIPQTDKKVKAVKKPKSSPKKKSE